MLNELRDLDFNDIGSASSSVRYLILGFLLATLPVASHLLARAAVVEAGLDEAIRNAPLVGDDPR